MPGSTQLPTVVDVVATLRPPASGGRDFVCSVSHPGEAGARPIMARFRGAWSGMALVPSFGMELAVGSIAFVRVGGEPGVVPGGQAGETGLCSRLEEGQSC